MGGIGSGRRSNRRTTDSMQALDVRQLRREGHTPPGTQALFLRTKQQGHASARQAIFLDWTARAKARPKPWFLCPVCGRRAAILYLGAALACRRCHGLAYQSQRDGDRDRLRAKAEALRTRLGWEPGILNPEGGRPKRMRRITFERLRSEHAELVRTLLGEWRGRFG